MKNGCALMIMASFGYQVTIQAVSTPHVPSLELPEAGWICPQKGCGHDNYGDQSEGCEMCGEGGEKSQE